MVREHDYELWMDITEYGNYNLHQDLNSFLKPKDLLLISKLLKKQDAKYVEEHLNINMTNGMSIYQFVWND